MIEQAKTQSPKNLPSWADSSTHTMSYKDVILGVEPDAPVVENENGGKQSDTPYGFHLVPTSAIFDAAKVLKYGADKYGETFTNRNYTKIDTIDHLNHALQHIYAFLAGDKQDDHLGHALVRLMFAYDVESRKPISPEDVEVQAE